MAHARSTLGAILRDKLEGWTIVDTARQLDSIPKPGAVVLWGSKRTSSQTNGLPFLVDEVTLWVLTAADKPDAVEDDLDALLETVLEAIEDAPAFAWTEAERGVLADRWQGWQLTLTAVQNITT